MRKLNFVRSGILLHLLFLTNFSNAQSSLTFTQAMDSLFAPLDKSRITTGILYERVKPFASIDLFNTSPADSFISEFRLFNQAYFELYYSTYNNNGWLKPEYLRAWTEGEVLQGKYNIGVLDYTFNLIDSNAVDNGQLTFSNGQFHDITGAPNPYWTRRLQMAAILVNELPTGLVSITYNLIL